MRLEKESSILTIEKEDILLINILYLRRKEE
jgi:hypothetical protein